MDQVYVSTEQWSSVLRRVEQEPCFYPVQRTRLINLGHVRRASRMAVTLTNGAKIPLGGSKYDEFCRRMDRFLS